MSGVFSVRRRRFVWAAVIVVVLVVGLIAAVGHPARAGNLSAGCEYLNDPFFDGFFSGVSIFGFQMFRGERIVGSVGPPTVGSPTTLSLVIDGMPVDTASYPGTVRYTVPHNGTFDVRFYVNDGIAAFSIRCLPPEPKEAPYTGIVLLSEAEQAPYLSIPNAAGATPCGVFDVNGWGAKYVGMGDFPGCTAPVTVMCLTGEGAWTADTVSGVVMHGDWEVDFTSSQDGTCALFEQ